jgi:hypothetical protein
MPLQACYACNPSYSVVGYRSGGARFKANPRQIVLETQFLKTLHKKGLVEWLKVKILSSSPSSAKKKKTKKTKLIKLILVCCLLLLESFLCENSYFI